MVITGALNSTLVVPAILILPSLSKFTEVSTGCEIVRVGASPLLEQQKPYPRLEFATTELFFWSVPSTPKR